MQTLQPESTQHIDRLRTTSPGTVAFVDHRQGYASGEPLIYALDGAIRYAKAYQSRFEQPLRDDYVLGPAYLRWITGLRDLCNGLGAVAMETGRGTDSKDNGTIEAMFWSAMTLGGFSESDL